MMVPGVYGNGQATLTTFPGYVPPTLTLFLFPWELDSMPEYSSTLPSGTTFGKVWRCNANDPYGCGIRGLPELWEVRMYAPHPDPRRVTIVRFEVVLRAGPFRTYNPPDWHYQEGWERERAAERAAAGTL